MKYCHDSHETKYREPFGAVPVGTDVHLTFRITDDDPVSSVTSVQLMVRREGKNAGSLPMREQSPGVYAVSFKTPFNTCLLWYYFRIEIEKNGEKKFAYYGNNESGLGGQGAVYDTDEKIPEYQITVYSFSRVPKWYKDAIVYQIFPDRFMRDPDWERRTRLAIKSRSGKSGQKQTLEIDWYKPAYHVRDEDNNVETWPFYGGSLKGIESRLGYLAGLGVKMIYLNPIFEAVSNHRYDTANYMNIDPILGTEEDFKSLCEMAAKLDIRIILDGVFSHTGADSIYFDRFGNYGGQGAWKNQNSRYKYWYHFNDNEPAGYKCRWGNKDFPEVEEGNLMFRQMVCGDNGILAKWIRAGASGWILDAADELSDDFIRNIRKRIKAEGDDNVLLGGVTEDAGNRTRYDEGSGLLLGDELDSTMNYPLRKILIDYVNYSCSATEALAHLMSLKENYPPESFYGAINLIGSHEKERILNLMGCDEDHQAAVRKVKMLATLQYSLPGVPGIYYGDEAGMCGGAVPENRSGYIWGRENRDIRSHFQNLGVYYHSHDVLKDGDFIPVQGTDDDILTFIRKNQDEQILVIANRSSNKKTFIYGEMTVDLDGLSCVFRSI